MKLTFETGDATLPNVSSPYWILHGCNDIGAWGSGFVVALNKRFGVGKKSPCDEYMMWFDVDPENVFATLPRLGDIQFVKINKNDAVLNMITQKGCGQVTYLKEFVSIPFRYESFNECLLRVKILAEKYKSKHGTYPNLVSPRIGCGLAMAEWSKVEKIILEVFNTIDINWTVYDLPPSGEKQK